MKYTQERIGNTDTYVFEAHTSEGTLTITKESIKTDIKNIEHDWYKNIGLTPVCKINANYFWFDIVGGYICDSGYYNNHAFLADKKFITLIYKNNKLILDEEYKEDILLEKYKGFVFITQIGNPLVKDGVKYLGDDNFDHSNYKNPRTFIGQKEDGTIVFFTTDGRSSNDSGFTINQLADIALEMGCVTAVNCDGGGSSTMVLEDEMVNDNENRKSYTAFIFYAKDYKLEKEVKEMVDLKIIGVDIGHSENTWEDTGGKGVVKADNSIFEEFHFNLKVGKELKDLLISDGRFTTVEAQPLDNTSPLVRLSDRVNIYDNSECDIVASIHANAHSNKQVKGKLFFYWGTSSNGKRLASLLDANSDILLTETEDDGIMACVNDTWTDFYLVHYTNAPCVLAEFAFFTNSDDVKLLEDDDFITRCAYSYYYTLCDYYNYEYRNKYTKKEIVTENSESWKLEGIQYLLDEGILTSESWLETPDEPFPSFAEALILKRVIKILKG